MIDNSLAHSKKYDAALSKFEYDLTFLSLE